MQNSKVNVALKNNYSLITFILFWCGLVIVASNYLTIPLMSTFTKEFNGTATTVALTGSAFSLCYAVGSLFSGPLSDSIGRKKMILIGLFSLSIITLLIPLFSNLLWIILLRSVQGFAAASFAPVALAYVVDKFPPRKIVTTIGFISSSFLVSAIIGQIFSSFLNEHFGWQSVFYYSGAIYLLTAILVLLLLPKVKVKQSASDFKKIFKQFQLLITDSKLIQFYVITLTLLLTFVAFYILLGDYLIKVFSLNESDIFYVRLLGIIGMLFAPFAGIFANKYGMINVLRSGLLLATLGIAVVGLSTNLYLLVAMSVVFVTGIAITVPTLISLISSFGGENHSSAISLYAFILFIGTSIGPMLAVLLLKIKTHLISFELLALLLLISFIIAIFNKPKKSDH